MCPEGDEFLAVADRVSAYVRKTGLAATAKSLDEAAHAVKVAEIDPFAEPPLAIQQMSRYAWVPLAGTPAPSRLPLTSETRLMRTRAVT